MRRVGVVVVCAALLVSCERKQQEHAKPTEAAAKPTEVAAKETGSAGVAVAVPAPATKPEPEPPKEPATVPVGDATTATAAQVAIRPIEEQFEERHETQALFDKVVRRIRNQLRTVAKAPVALRDTAGVAADDLSSEIFGLYEYSAYEECVRGHPNRQDGRKECLGDHTNRLRINRACIVLGVVHASFGVPAPDDFGSGTLKVTSAPVPDTLCIVGETKVLAIDVDQDDKPELYADFTTSERFGGETRSPGEAPTFYDSVARHIVIYDGGGKPPLVLTFALQPPSVGGTIAPKGDLIAFHDLDGDGYRELIALEPCLEGMTDCDQAQVPRTIYVHDRKLDRWVKGEPAAPAR